MSWFVACPVLSHAWFEALRLPRRPSVLAATIGDGNEALTARIERLRDPLCDAAGVARDARPPLPHVTLGRFRRNATRPERAAALAWADAADLSAVAIELGALALYRSAEDDAASRYVIVASAT